MFIHRIHPMEDMLQSGVVERWVWLNFLELVGTSILGQLWVGGFPSTAQTSCAGSGFGGGCEISVLASLLLELTFGMVFNQSIGLLGHHNCESSRSDVGSTSPRYH